MQNLERFPKLEEITFNHVKNRKIDVAKTSIKRLTILDDNICEICLPPTLQEFDFYSNDTLRITDFINCKHLEKIEATRWNPPVSLSLPISLREIRGFFYENHRNQEGMAYDFSKHSNLEKLEIGADAIHDTKGFPPALKELYLNTFKCDADFSNTQLLKITFALPILLDIKRLPPTLQELTCYGGQFTPTDFFLFTKTGKVRNN